MTTSRSKDNGHWIFPEQLDFLNAVGFIYLIKNLITGMMYIGKKIFAGMGKKNKGVQSNWRTYMGSSKSLLEEISRVGKENFKFYVLEQYYTKGGYSFAETWSQIVSETPCHNDRFYNRFIDKITWKVTEPPSERHRKRLRDLTK